jgi:hypothetical protein
MNYVLRTHNVFTGGLPWLFGDYAEDDLPLAVRIRSGEYFATLATQLDAISDTLADDNEAERVNLQKLADELLKLQKQYKITPKV